jgi:hypothetical protein
MGQALRFAPLLSACTRKALGGPIQTIQPAFDGLKVFPSLAGLSIARFGRSLIQACQPASVSAHRVSALAPQSGGLRGLIDAEMSKYLLIHAPSSGHDRLIFENICHAPDGDDYEYSNHGPADDQY